MNVIRDKALVNQYHFDARNLEWEEKNGVPTTRLTVDFQLVEHNAQENKTSIVVILRFMIVLDHFVISGAMSQGVHILEQLVQEVDEFSEEDKRFLVNPLLDILQRLTYEVTEIALDAPGVNLEI